MNFSFTHSKYIWLPLSAGVLMLAVPLLRDLHIEPALLVALVGCFWSSWRACSHKSNRSDEREIAFIFRTLYLVAIPLVIYALATGCLSWHGIGFWLFYPIPSVLLGYSLGRLLRIWDIPYRRLISTLILILIAVGVLLYEFFNFPQVYFFNHVWGGWPGPIYDETVKVSWSLVFYRGMTLAWASLLWWVPAFRQSLKAKVIVAVSSIFLIFSYMQLAEMGIISPRSYLQQQLGGEKQTSHFTLFYDEEHYTDDRIEFIAKKQEFYFQQITDTLNIEWPDSGKKIESYLYAHPWQKKKLVGAKFTSYVPVWLDQDQLHIAKPQVAGSLKHELVHVLSKQFGNKLFNASWSIGLIEGLAVALAPSEAQMTTINQIVVSEKPYPTAEEMEDALSPLGFYGGRSTVNYTQTGSFVQYLLQNRPVANFKQAYPCGDIAGSYNQPFERMVEGWHRALDAVEVDSTDRRIARRLYAFPSLFEQECPRVQSQFARLWDKYSFSMAEADTAEALKYLDQAKEETPEYGYVKNQWLFLNLEADNIQLVLQQASIQDSTADGLLLYADAFALHGNLDSANTYVAKAARYLKNEEDSLLKEALQTRMDSMQWQYYREIIYRELAVSDSIFAKLHHRTQMRAIQQAIERENHTQIIRYASISLSSTKNNLYFDKYIRLIEHLAFYGEMKLADNWLKQVSELQLRARYRERLHQVKEWVDFLEVKREPKTESLVPSNKTF